MTNVQDPSASEFEKKTTGLADSIGRHSNGRTIWLAGRWIIIIAIGIMAISYGLFFYFQNAAQNDFRQNLFDQQRGRQLASVKAIAQHVESDLEVISSKLAIIANYYSTEQSLSTSKQAFDQSMKAEMQQILDTINSPKSPPLSSESSGESYTPIVDALYVIDENGIVRLDTRPDGSENIEGTDVSSRQYVIDTKEQLVPQYSRGYSGTDGNFRIAATYPIIDDALSGSEKYKGIVVATMTTSQFFNHYGNIYDIKSQYIAVLDRDSNQLAHPVQSFIGKPFFGEYTQNATGHNEVLNSLIRKVMTGVPDYTIYNFVNGDRLNSGYPIYFHDQPTYFVFIVTPTSTIYAAINDILDAQQTQIFSVLAASTAAIAALVFLLTRWNHSLNRAVGDRTMEIAMSNQQLQRAVSQLQESYRQLSFANERLIAMNEQLVRSEKIQKEFVNVAAHELRTPIQPIIGLTEILRNKTNDQQMRTMIDTIARSAERMQHLSSDILDVTRIESQTLRLNKQEFEINPLLSNVIQDLSSKRDETRLPRSQSNDDHPSSARATVEIEFEKPLDNENIWVFADKERIIQVASNLLENALKFTNAGKVIVTAEKSNGFNGIPNNNGNSKQHDGHKFVEIKVQDTGRGIDSEVFPKLFTKFVTKSDRGTGLGLFISKGIIEAHGGKIWALNNPDGRGATFCFTLPMYESMNSSER